MWRVEEDTVSLVYYETGETNVVPKSSADLVPFTQQTIENLKLDQMKSRKLQKAIAAAEASMWVGINSIQLSENDCALSIALICSIVSTELSRNCKRYVVLANISYSYPQMQWLFDVKICIVEIHTSVIILWFFYFMKGIKLHWNICCYKRENVDVIWIRFYMAMQCRGIKY